VQQRITTPCGIFAFELAGRGKRHFQFTQHYNLITPVTIHKDALVVIFRDDPVPLQWGMEQDNGGQNGSVILEDEGVLEVRFTLGEGVFDQDTIFVKMENYILCEEGYLPKRLLFFHFNRGEFLRIE
jgi:hypothetical protein